MEVLGELVVGVLVVLHDAADGRGDGHGDQERPWIDLKRGGMAPLTMIARTYSLAAGSAAVGTRDNEVVHQTHSLAYVPGPRLRDTPLYILTSDHTASAGEASASGDGSCRGSPASAEAT